MTSPVSSRYEAADKKAGFSAGALRAIFMNVNPQASVKAECTFNGRIKAVTVTNPTEGETVE